jgi:hypothetical protein
MNLDDMTIGDAKRLAAMFGGASAPLNNGMIGKYVIVRCRDAGVHCGVLESHSEREAVLIDSRRLWYWKPAGCGKYLSGLAIYGADSSSKIGVALPRLHLTETCEIIQCSSAAEASLRAAKEDAR